MRTPHPASLRLRLVLTAALAAALVVPPSLARAAPPRTREQREVDARKACGAGHVDQGIEILADLYASYSHPNYIYNQGRCYQENGKNEQAVSRFREYLRVATDAPTAVREKVEQWIRELEGEKATPAPPPPPPPMPEPMPVRPIPPSSPPVVTQKAPPTFQPSPALKAASVAFAVVGGVGFLGGLLAGSHVHTLQKEVEDATYGKFDVDQLADHEKEAHRFETLQWVGYGLAGIGLVGAVVCTVANDAPGPRATTASSSSSPPTVRVAGLPGSPLSIAVTGRF